mgnify:FL=1
MTVRKNMYNDMLKSIPAPENIPEFNTEGKLIICLIEYRIMDEIEWVINAMLRVYDSKEIGFSIIHGTTNNDYIQERYGNWKNIKLINTNHDNLDRGSYSALLKMPTIYENFTNWSHILIYQTDALIMRKIDDVYFDFDYIGSPWSESNQFTKYNAGNGGFSLRNVKASIRVCEKFRNTKHQHIHRGNEDGFFCCQDSFKYPPVNEELHKNFGMEKVKFKWPIGVHQVYVNWSLNNDEYKEFINYCKDCLIEKKPYSTNKMLIDKYINNKNLIITKNNFEHIKDNILVYELFSGVGYYNQLFSLEIGLYLAKISNRHLILNIKHPLVAAGIPNRNYGCIIEYLDENFSKDLIGFEYNLYEKCCRYENPVNIPSKISNCAIIDKDLDTEENQESIKDFCHFRRKVSSKNFDSLFNSNKKVVSFTMSNASRVFSNFYTTQDNYKIMNKICKSVSTYNGVINEVYEDVRKSLSFNEYISIHFRFGDAKKNVEQISQNNSKIKENLYNWLEKNNTEKLPLMIMADRKDNPFLEELKKDWVVYFTDELITTENKTKLSEKYNKTTVAEFLIQKRMCEDAKIFIGSQGSTVSVHIQYINFINNKPYKYYMMVGSTAYNSETLMMDEKHPKKHWSWKRLNYMGGHPMSWSMFFEDNIEANN